MSGTGATPTGALLPAHARAVTLVILTAVVAEAAIGSSGRWFVVGPLSIRTILLGACLVAGLPLVWRERRYLLGEGIVWVTSLFVLTLAVSALWAYHLGNATTFIVNDLTTFSALLLVPTVVALRLSVTEVARLLAVLFVSATALAAVTMAIHVLIPLGVLDPAATADWLSDRSLGGLTDVGEDVHRIYFRSQILFLPAFLIGLQRIARAEGRRLLWLAGTSLLAVGLILSLSRSLWIGFALAFIVALMWCSRDLLALLRAAALAGAGAAALVLGSMAVYGGPALPTVAVERLDPSLAVGVPGVEDQPAEDKTSDLSGADAESVALRGITLVLTQEKIRERPITGWGIGYNLDSIRSDGRTEYMYWDMLMKLGLVGMVPFLLTYAWLPLGVLRRGRLLGFASDARILSAGLIGVVAASYFNPFLISTLGISLLLLLVAATGAGSDLEPQASAGTGHSEDLRPVAKGRQ